MGDRHRREVNAFEAPDVDRGHAVSLGIDPLTVRMNAANRTEAVLDYVLVEGIRARVLLRRQQAQILAGDEPQQGTLALAHRAVAGHRAVDFTLDLEGQLATVAAAFVLHAGPS